MTTTTTSKKPNYKIIEGQAYNFLERYTDGRLPINLIHIINQLDNLHLMKYSTFAKQHSLPMLHVIEYFQSEDGALWYQPITDTYILLYNDTIANKERIRFTIAHELGHYVLKHNELTDKTIISRGGLTNEEYNLFEQEANFFAKHLLVPFPILGNYVQFFNHMDTSFIQRVFQVSYSVATNVISNLKAMQKSGISKVGHIVEERFNTYIATSQSTRICKSCHSKINRYTKYCHICSMEQYEGLTTLEAYLDNQVMEKERMRYFKYPINESGYPEKCPRCENEELETANYCNVCGLYTQNICLGSYESNYNSCGYPLPIADFLKDGCGKNLSGNSRYCPDCGGKSAYFFQSLLKNWDIEKKEMDEITF